MAIGGGTFTAMNKKLPGAYINFVSTKSAATLGERGIVTLPLELDWGADGALFTLTAADFMKEALPKMGYEPTHPKTLLAREALKRAKMLLVYRVNGGGQKATATVGGLAVTAKYSGVRGNDLTVAVLSDADDENGFVVTTYLGGTEVDSQKAAAADELTDSDYITFGGGTLAAAAATPLTGGQNGTATGQAYADYLAAVEVENFNTIGYPGTEASVKALIEAFVKRLRYGEGKKIVGVLFDHKGDDIGLINVKNGVVLADGTVIDGSRAVAWVAGASAGAEVNQSLTGTAYEGAVDADIKLTTTQYEAAVKAGEFAFYGDGQAARVLTDVNSLVTFGGGVSEDWVSNRVVRVMDGWANDIARIFSTGYMGRQTNSKSGRDLFKADIVALGSQYEQLDAISGFDSEDIAVQEGTGKRDVVVSCALTPNDSMEKLYMTVQVD